eukprot:SM000276S10290  [mRNA]  locus=s276:23736:26631:+ [translate_table: standard]
MVVCHCWCSAQGVCDDQRAYEVWVSEVMLQQTRAATAAKYYPRWLCRWPTVQALAAATQEEVNEEWAGLGYYRRARFLREGAVYIVEKLGGSFPREPEGLLQIPGIGRYTAGAIASIAFHRAVPAVDGNVVRVLSRLRAIATDPKASATVQLHWSLAQELAGSTGATRPGDWTQALMELGSTLCTPAAPRCGVCPVARHCDALRLLKVQWPDDRDCAGSQRTAACEPSVQADEVVRPHAIAVTDFPARTIKAAPRQEHVDVCVVEMLIGSGTFRSSTGVGRRRRDRLPASDEREGQVEHARKPVSTAPSNTSMFLLVQRPPAGLLAGLWEFPTVPVHAHQVKNGSRRANVDAYVASLVGLDLTQQEEGTVMRREIVGTYLHQFSHIHQRMDVDWLLLQGTAHKLTGGPQGVMEAATQQQAVKWVSNTQMAELGITAGVRKHVHEFSPACSSSFF